MPMQTRSVGRAVLVGLPVAPNGLAAQHQDQVKPLLDDRIAKIRDYARPKNATSRMATAKMHARALASVTIPENHREPGILGSAVF